mmetsp:Transcript_76804/g.138559  ORF Transcript_76804/g.138559 Transcript_76804/m.138559 type:complete len:218 (+) Transcript_76804:391-1044(+)
MAGAHVPKQDLLVDAPWADECRVEVLRMIRRHDKDAIRRVHHAIQHVQQPRQVQLVLLHVVSRPHRGTRAPSVSTGLAPAIHHGGHHAHHRTHVHGTPCCWLLVLLGLCPRRLPSITSRRRLHKRDPLELNCRGHSEELIRQGIVGFGTCLEQGLDAAGKLLDVIPCSLSLLAQVLHCLFCLLPELLVLAGISAAASHEEAESLWSQQLLGHTAQRR